MGQSNLESLMTFKDVSKMTGIPESTLRYYRHMRKGPKSALVGRRVMYRVDDVRAWIDDQFKEAND